MTGTDSNSSNETKENYTKNPGETWGYDLYPERRRLYTPSIGKILATTGGREDSYRTKCEQKVFRCIEKSPLVKLMMGALKGSGCEIDIRRHISCEVCDGPVTGGYDPELNQIVICQNMVKNKGIMQGVLAHEMVHMFDYCTRELDFKNIEHLACTEIRAANLTHCSFLNALFQGNASLINIAKTHEECVKSKALYSVMSARKIELGEAMYVINKVFPKCYADLEPVGRRIRRNSNDMTRAYLEGFLYGYEL